MAFVWMLLAFVLMEPATALAHRGIMHGRGMVWHRSHHGRRMTRFEANDLFPACFAGITMLAIGVGFNVPALGVLVPVGAGVTLYGVAYTLVHDGVVHRRFRMPAGGRYLRHVVESHALHHRYGAAPYGMLVPVVPAEIRRRADPSSASVARARQRVGAVPRA